MNIRTWFKRSAQSFLLYCGYRQIRDLILGLTGNAHVMVLCYHVVTEKFHPNGIQPATFRKHIQWLNKKFRVVSIEESTDILIKKKKTKKPICAVTFDDGYAENYLHALPILREFSIPATFFVASGFVDKAITFPDDQKRGLIDFLPFSSHQLKSLSEAGMSIGSHTSSHVDCGVEENLHEIGSSKRELEEILGLQVTTFAFPYGKSENIHPYSPKVLKTAGYTCGFSCYGGYNYPRTDGSGTYPDQAPVFKRIHAPSSDSGVELLFQLTMQDLIVLRKRVRTSLSKVGKTAEMKIGQGKQYFVVGVLLQMLATICLESLRAICRSCSKRRIILGKPDV